MGTARHQDDYQILLVDDGSPFEPPIVAITVAESRQHSAIRLNATYPLLELISEGRKEIRD
jgi:hypothetical protein